MEPLRVPPYMTVVPAQAGTHSVATLATVLWVPACAGTTVGKTFYAR
jgi:hypothetical protein